MGNKILYYSKQVAREQASSTQGVAKVYPRCSQGLPKVLTYSMSMLRVCLHLGYSMLRVWVELASPKSGQCQDRHSSESETMFLSQQINVSLTAKQCFSILMLLMLFLGVSDVKAQLPTTTTDTNGNSIIEENEKNYYLLQNVGTPSFYAVPYTNDDETFISTANVPNSDMRFYFMSVENEAGYYYIIHSSGKYLYAMGNANADGGARLKASATTPTDDRYKFSIEQNEGGYYIINKQLGSSAPLCKRGGNTYIGKNSDNKPYHYFLKMNTYTPVDDYFRWNFIPISNTTPITWTAPFTLSTDESKFYYKIKNSVDSDYYISGSESTVNTSSTESNDIAWCFMEVPVGENGSDTYITYYYIIHALTGKYMCFDGDPTKYTQNQENVVSIQDKTAANEENCQFIVVRSSQNKVNNLYNIIPKALKNYIWNNQSLDKKDKATIVRTATDRSGETNRARWIFETATYTNAWTDPEIDCDENGTITITQSEGAAVRYTITNSNTPPATPTSSDELYDDNHKPTAETGFTTIKARAIGGTKQSSNVVTKAIVYNPTITFTTGDETYSGASKVPVVKVGETTINSTEYNIAYKKGGVAAEFMNVGSYTIELTDADGGDYIVYGSGNLLISKAPVTVTANNQTKEYGDTEDPELTFTASGLLGSDTEANSFTGALTREPGDAFGTYAISQGTLDSDNYTITSFTGATLTITPKAITITADSGEKVYDGTALTKSSYTSTSLVAGDEIESVTITGSQTNAGSSDNIPSGAIIKKGETDITANYNITYANGTLTINPKAVTITASNASKDYDGTALTEAGFTATDLEEGDTHTFTVTMTAESTITNVGTQPNVIATVDGVAVTTGIETAVGNYLVTTEDGTLTINSIITVNLDDWIYGSPNNPSVTGNTGNAEVTYSYKKQSEDDTKYKTDKPVSVGNYTVKADVAATATTAAVTATKDFSITKAPLEIKADAKEKDYLDDDPKLTYSVTGLKNNDVEGNVITCVLQRETGEVKGEYAITRKSSSVKSGNYSFNTSTGFTAATFTINPKNLGDGENPASGISIYAQKTGETSWEVSVYNGKKALEGSDYSYTVEENKVTITAASSNCTGSAQATYSSDVTFYAINGTTEKFTPYISTTSDLTTSEDLVPYIVAQINPTLGTISIVPISYIPEGEPVLLLGSSDVTGITTSMKNPATPAISESLINSNQLLIAPDEPSDPADPESVHGVHVENTEAYMFYKGEFVLTTAGTIKKGNFYLYNPNYNQVPSTDPTPAPMRYLSIVKGETTGIIQLTNDEAIEGINDVWHSIDGQKYNKKPTRKGIYIQNSKKLIVK